MVTLLGAAAIEIFVFQYWTLFGNKDVSGLIPWTFHTLWEAAALIGIAYVVKRCGIELEVYAVTLVLGAILAGIVWMFMPDSFRVIGANYFGVESRASLETHEEGRFDERVEYDYPLSLGFLYKNGDPELEREIAETKRRSDYVRTRGFIFWQTGLAYGFTPFGLDGYNGGFEFIDKVKLFFTVGPIVIIESFIKGMIDLFGLLMAIQIIWFLILKEHVWWS